MNVSFVETVDKIEIRRQIDFNGDNLTSIWLQRLPYSSFLGGSS